MWRHTWWKNCVNCAVATGNSSGLRTVLSSRLSYRELRSSLREPHTHWVQFFLQFFYTVKLHSLTFYSLAVSLRTARFNIKKFYLVLACVECFVRIREQTATCALYSLSWLVFITEMKSVYSAVRTGSLNIAVCASSVKGYVFCIYLRTNNDLCHIHHILIGFYNRDEKCLQRGTDWAFK